jgi:hypothetical protein
LTSAGGPERVTPFLEWVRPCFLGLPMEPVVVMWLLLLLRLVLLLPLRCSVSLRECVDCHFEVPADLRGREEVLLLPDLPDLVP